MAGELSHIHLVYRIFLLWAEPFFAFNGAILCHFYPTSFLNTMSATAKYSPSSQVIFDQLAATYVLFAFNEAVVLRVTNDLSTWKAIVSGIILCDIIHLYASWCALGTEVFTNPTLWRAEDLLNMSLLYGPVCLRLAFLAEVGVKTKNNRKKA